MSNFDFLATVSKCPVHDADGYSYGGDVILTFRDTAINFGCRNDGLPQEVANRWNAHDDLFEALDGLLSVVKAAGVNNLMNGVQLGAVSWGVKANYAVEQAERALLSQMEGK